MIKVTSLEEMVVVPAPKVRVPESLSRVRPPAPPEERATAPEPVYVGDVTEAKVAAPAAVIHH